MAVSVGELVAKLKLDTSDFSKGASDASSQSKSLSSTISSNLSSIGGNMTKFVTLPILAVGAALLQVGTQFDDAFDTIRTGTGQTGAVLEGLEQSFRNVVADVPASFANASMAIADLSTRTGATGQALEDLAKTELELARITGGDLKAQIASTTRLFGDWGIATDRQAGSLDFLFKVGQQTGVGVDSLASKLVQFGAPLRQMGFDFETSAALMGKFEKEGVNLELVMGSLRIALGKMSKEGIKDPAQALQVLTDRIKNAGSAGEANAMALKTFGARAGPDMAAAIREGRFEIDGLLSSLRSSPETIMSAARETADFAEQFTLLKNQVMLALEPLGAKLFQALNNLMPAFQAVVGWIKSAVEWFSNLPSGVQTTIAVLVGLAAAVGPVLLVVGKLIAIFSGASAAIALLTNPIGLVIAALVAIGVAVVAAYNKFESFREIVDSVAKFISDAFKQIWDAVKSFAAAAWPVLVGLWNEYKDTVIGALKPVIQVWTEHKDLILKILGAIALGLTGPIGAIVLFATKFKDAFENVKEVLSNFSGFFKQVWENFLTVVETVWKTVSNVIAAGVKLISSIVKAGQGDWAGAWEDYKSAADFAWKAILALIEGAGKLMLGIMNAAWQLVIGAARTAWDALVALIKAAWDALTAFLTERVPFLLGQLATWFSKLPENLPGYMTQAWELIKSAVATGGAKVITTAKEWLDKLPSLIDEMAKKMTDRVASLAEDLPQRFLLLGLKAYNKFKEGMDAHSPTGPEKLIIQMAKGMGVTLDEAIPKLSAKAQKLGDSIAKHINDGLKSIGITFDVSLREILNFSDKWRKAADEIGDKARELAETKRQVGLVIALSYDVARKAFDEFIKKDNEGRQTIVKNSDIIKVAVPITANVVGKAHADMIEAWLAHERAADEAAEAIKNATEKMAADIHKNLTDEFQRLSNELPQSWNKIIDGILNGSGRLGSELLKLGVTIKGWASDIIGLVGTIPGAFGDAARKVLSTVDQWVQFGDRVLAVLNRLNSKIPGSMEDLISVILTGMTKAQHKVEAVLDDIFGPVQGEKSGKGFAESFMGQIKDIFSGKGGITGVLSNILSVGGIVTGLIGLGKSIWGGIKSIFGIGGKSDEQKAAEEQAKKEAAQAFARSAVDIMQAGLNAFDSAIDLMFKAADYVGTPRKALKKLVNDTKFLMIEFFDMLKDISKDVAAHGKEISEAFLPALQTLLSVLDLGNAMKDRHRPKPEDFKEVVEDFDLIGNLLEKALEDAELKVAKKIGKIANKLSPAFALLRETLDINKLIVETPDPDPAAIERQFNGMFKAVELFEAGVEKFKTFALAKTKRAAEQISAIAKAIIDSMGLSKAINEAPPLDEAALAARLSELDKVLVWQDEMNSIAARGLEKSLSFEDMMTQWRDSIARGLSALASLAGSSFNVTAGNNFQNAAFAGGGSGLNSLALPGGGGGGLGSSFTSSSAPVHVHMNVQGSVFHDQELQDLFIEAYEVAIDRGRVPAV